jgi:2,4-dienoyl-CoA reductase-like NADH-dependent reductase (Old Yellow Enzyme family)
MRIEVDWELCDGQGVCAEIAPTLFEVTEDDRVHVLDPTPPVSMEETVADNTESYAALLEPIRIGPVVVPNRLIRSGAGTGLALAQSTPDFIEYHAARARGGVGLLVVADTQIHPSTGGAIPIWRDDAVPGMRALADAIHGAGKVVFQMLSHHGASATTGASPWSASAIPDPQTGVVPIPMSSGMIADIVAAYAAAARRSRDAGMDGIEIHAGHGFLISQFLSPLTNHRTDEYGGSLENRARLLREVLDAVRAEVGADIAVGVRVSAAECLPGAIDVDETKQLVLALEGLGLVDFVDVSLGHLRSYPSIIGGMHEAEGYQLETSRRITAMCTTPTVVAGRITSLRLAAKLVEDGTAQLVSLLRATIADPDLVRKSVTGRAAEVRPCIACNECFRAVTVEGRIACAVNPQAVPPYPAIASAAPRRVVVVGGGPAGCEAAHVARTAGHDVVLLESRDRLGGALRDAGAAPHRHPFVTLADWYETELARLGVDVRLVTQADIALVGDLRPDHVIVASGARALRDGRQIARPGLRLRGVELPHVHTAVDVHRGAGSGARRAAVLDDLGSYDAIGVAEQLAAQGTQVAIVTRLPGPAASLGGTLERDPARQRLERAGVRCFAGFALAAIDATGVDLESLGDAGHVRLPSDLVVLISGYEPVAGLADELRAAGLATTVVGDAAMPGRLRDATSSALRAVLDLDALMTPTT